MLPHRTLTRARAAPALARLITTTTATAANPLPHPTVSGPPPKAPTPAVTFPSELIQRKRKQAALLKSAQQLKTNPAQPTAALARRFWKDVHVRREADGLHILLDTRPVRTPSKAPLVVPAAKPHLATAIALEWDHLVSAQQALKTQYIPLTSLASRALDLAAADAADGPSNATRAAIITMLLRYLGTDTLLCWAPAKTTYADFAGEQALAPGERSLRDLQQATAQPIVDYLTTHVWPGAQLAPALDETSILPRAQAPQTVQLVRGWLTGLPPWDLAALERAVLASKSLCVGVRLLTEWSAHFAGVRADAARAQAGSSSPLLDAPPPPRFDVLEAERACNLEVAHQTRNWGEVEDTHDVNREDLRRQLGSAVLLVQ